MTHIESPAQNPPDFKPVESLLTSRIGLRAEFVGRPAVRAHLASLLARQGGTAAQFARDCVNSANLRSRCWQELLDAVANTESHFFRSSVQIQFLREYLLPNLLGQAQRASRPLRLWSAGTSRGEEAWTLAMICADLRVDFPNVEVTILGTDILDSALEIARAARYSEWSLRGVPHAERETRFRQQGQGFDLWPRPPGVQFKWFNLAGDDLPPMTDIDLVVCRNVFLYLHDPAIAHALQHFHRALRPGGWLLIGQGELLGKILQGFDTKPFPQNVVYCRQTQSRTAPDASGAPKPLPRLASVRERLIPDRDASNVPRKTPVRIDDPVLDLSGLLAEMRWKAASAWVEDLLRRNPFDARFHYVAAILAELLEDALKAAQHLERVIFLEPARVHAYVDLALLRAQQGHVRSSNQLRRAAITLLKQYAPEVRVRMFDDIRLEVLFASGESEGVTVAELRTYLQFMVPDSSEKATKT
ncbi:MAG: methyltransferase domain-containing protein [Gammaproteobacteria bacterium]|nr:methyltransferase domain-containing protein [Gammaproteobacteria bacterium]MCP5135664.1 methyltransferase domain-containing protein [Gammaproteobacteria bacterium]